MGNLMSHRGSVAEEFGLTKAQARQLELATGASVRLSRREVSRLFRLFKKLDFDSNGTLDIPELLSWIDEPVEIESFASRVFACR